MSGIISSGVNGSNSNLPDSTGRVFTTSFSAQSGSAGAVLNQSGGLHNIHGSFNMPNIPGSYASRSSTNLGGLPSGVQQAPGSMSNGRYAINSLPNALAQLSLGSSHAHSGGANTGGPVPSMGNTGRLTNSIGGLVGGGTNSRGGSSGGVANIPGLTSRLNLSAPQMVSMLGNSYPGAGVPLSQNQFQAGNNNFSYMALLNDANIHDSTNFDINDFPQLSGRPPSAGGSHGQIGLMQKHNIGFTQQNQEFSIQNEDFPALPGYKGGLNVGGGADYTVNTHQKEQIHDSMANLMQSQQLPLGRSPSFNFGTSYSSHHPQQHRASSISGNGVSYLTSGSQDLLFHGPEQYQQFQQPQSRFINPFRDKEIKSPQGSQPVPDQYGMLGLLSIIKMVNPALTSLALGLDLTTLGLNLNSSGTLHKKFASPWSDEPVKGEPEYSVPECYHNKPSPPPLQPGSFARFRPETLFYIFYSMPKDEAQLFAANELYNRGWFYHRELRLWFTRSKNMEPPVKTNTYERGCYFCFDPNAWQTSRKENFVLQYDMVEKWPSLPRQQQS